MDPLAVLAYWAEQAPPIIGMELNGPQIGSVQILTWSCTVPVHFWLDILITKHNNQCSYKLHN